MAACDMVATEWGYLVGGTDTGARTVSSTTIFVKAMAFAGNADDATAAITSAVGAAGTATSCFKFKVNGWDLDCAQSYVFLGENGIAFTNMIVTLSHANDLLYIFLA